MIVGSESSVEMAFEMIVDINDERREEPQKRQHLLLEISVSQIHLSHLYEKF